MGKKQYCCDMTFEVGADCCEECEQYHALKDKESFDFCTFWGKVKENDTEPYKKFSGVILRLAMWRWEENNRELSILSWHELHDERVMEAMFDGYVEMGMCDTMEEHMENWGQEEYVPDGTMVIPIELIQPLTAQEVESAQPLKRTFTIESDPMEGQMSLFEE